MLLLIFTRSERWRLEARRSHLTVFVSSHPSAFYGCVANVLLSLSLYIAVVICPGHIEFIPRQWVWQPTATTTALAPSKILKAPSSWRSAVFISQRADFFIWRNKSCKLKLYITAAARPSVFFTNALFQVQRSHRPMRNHSRSWATFTYTALGVQLSR